MDKIALLATRRRLLSERAAQQRKLLHEAYENLEPTIRYAGYGVEAVQFLRRSPLPVAIGTGLLSFFAGKVFPRIFGFHLKKPAAQDKEIILEQKKTGGKKELLLNMAKQAWQVYQFYRHIKAHLP